MHWFDTVILGVVGLGAIFGAMTGLLWQLARVVGFIAALYAAIFLNGWATRVLADVLFRGAEPGIPRAVAYVVVFLVVYLVLFSAIVLVEKAVRGSKLQPLDRVFGACLGAIKTAFILGAVFLGMVLYPDARTDQLLQDSKLAGPLMRVTDSALVAIPQEFCDAVRSGLEHLRQRGNERPSDPFAAPAPVPAPNFQ